MALVASSAGIIFLPIIGGLVLFVLIGAGVKAPGRALQRKFVATNPLKGKTEQEIVANCGLPTARSAMAGGYLLQWQATGYHIALTFDSDGNCLGVRHEHAAR